MILLVTQILILCYIVVEGLVVIIIIVSTLTLKAGQIRKACRLGSTSTQSFKQPYGLCCLSGMCSIVPSTLHTQLFGYGLELVPSTAVFPRTSLHNHHSNIANRLCTARAVNKGKLQSQTINLDQNGVIQ